MDGEEVLGYEDLASGLDKRGSAVSSAGNRNLSCKQPRVCLYGPSPAKDIMGTLRISEMEKEPGCRPEYEPAARSQPQSDFDRPKSGVGLTQGHVFQSQVNISEWVARKLTQRASQVVDSFMSLLLG
jgi:hypothetical protein